MPDYAGTSLTPLIISAFVLFAGTSAGGGSRICAGEVAIVRFGEDGDIIGNSTNRKYEVPSWCYIKHSNFNLLSWSNVPTSRSLHTFLFHTIWHCVGGGSDLYQEQA